MFWIRGLYQMGPLQMFFPSMRLAFSLFSFLASSFVEQKLLILIKSSVSINSFMDHAFGAESERSSPYPRSSGFSLILSSSFRVLHFTFWSMIYFELLIVRGIRSVLESFLHMDVQLVQHLCLKRLFLFHCISFLLCQRSVDFIYVDLFLGSLFSFINCAVYSFAPNTLSG